MKIPKQLPQFKREEALILVTGKQDAVFYRAHDGIIERLDAFKIPRPRYSDREGHFKVRGKGKTYASGAMLEYKDGDIINKFIHELKKRIKKMNNSPAQGGARFKSLYLFVPSQTRNAVRKALPKSWVRKLSAEVSGNFYYRSPLDILEKLRKE